MAWKYQTQGWNEREGCVRWEEMHITCSVGSCVRVGARSALTDILSLFSKPAHHPHPRLTDSHTHTHSVFLLPVCVSAVWLWLSEWNEVQVLSYRFDAQDITHNAISSYSVIKYIEHSVMSLYSILSVEVIAKRKVMSLSLVLNISVHSYKGRTTYLKDLLFPFLSISEHSYLNMLHKTPH